MKADLIQLDLQQVDSSGRPMGEGRSEGVHLSQVIRWAKARAMGPERDTGNENFITMGFLFEHLIEQSFRTFGQMMRKDRSRIVRSEEYQLDGIFCTPDAFDNSEGRQEEYKATYTSMGRLIGTNPDKGDCSGDALRWLKDFHWWWLVQIMAYCWGRGTQLARLIVLFVNGDYTHKPPFGGPQLVVIDLEFTLVELQQNWETVLRDRDEMLEEKGEDHRT